MVNKVTKAQRNVLIKAAGIVEDGWCQHDYYSRSTGCHCLVGAVSNAMTGHPYPSPDVFLLPILKKLGGAVECFDLYEFNDSPGRTMEEVQQILLEVAHS